MTYCFVNNILLLIRNVAALLPSSVRRTHQRLHSNIQRNFVALNAAGFSTLLCNTSTSVGHFNATLLHLNTAGISTLLRNPSSPQASQRNIVAFQPAIGLSTAAPLLSTFNSLIFNYKIESDFISVPHPLNPTKCFQRINA